MFTYRVLAAATFVLFGADSFAPIVHGADFRIDNTVYLDGQSQPQSQGVTIFHEGLVYDFLNDPAEVIVFDKNHRRFILLDLTRHVRSEVSTEDVRAFVDRVKQRLAGHPNPAIKWMVDPSFEENFDRDSEQLSLKSSAISYQARIQATVPVVAAQYHEFSDWYAQFNMVLNPSSRPPFARMMLNDAIERNKGIAREVHLTVALSSKDPPTKITSRHQLALQLDAADMNRIAEVRDDLRSFQSVSLRDYRQGK